MAWLKDGCVANHKGYVEVFELWNGHKNRLINHYLLKIKLQENIYCILQVFVSFTPNPAAIVGFEVPHFEFPTTSTAWSRPILVVSNEQAMFAPFWFKHCVDGSWKLIETCTYSNMIGWIVPASLAVHTHAFNMCTNVLWADVLMWWCIKGNMFARTLWTNTCICVASKHRHFSPRLRFWDILA